MRNVQKIIPHYAVEDWQHGEGVWELIDGHPLTMSPSPVPKHQRIAAEMRTELILALRRAKCKSCRAYDPIDYIIADDTVLVPDVLVVCSGTAKKFLDSPPVLAVEILSPSTALRDRNTKLQLYQQQGIKFYLLVDTENKKLETYRLVDGSYKIQEETDGFLFELENDCRIDPDFSTIFDEE